MTKLYRILGKRGRITIPYEIRKRVGFSYNDILSFAEQDDRTVIVRREKLCNDCRKAPGTPDKPEPEGITLLDFLDSLSAKERCAGRSSKAVNPMSKILRVVMVEPREAPYELNITDQLEDLQETVGGMIEVIGNGDGTLLVCNEESKLMGMDGNRRLNGDVIAGPFFVVGTDGENFRSLTDAEVNRYLQVYAEPQQISQREVRADMGMTFYCF